MPVNEVRLAAPLCAAASTRTLRSKLLAMLPLKPRVSVRTLLALPATLEIESPETLGVETSSKLVVPTLLPKAWSVPSVTLSSAPLRFDSSSDDGLASTVTDV